MAFSPLFCTFVAFLPWSHRIQDSFPVFRVHISADAPVICGSFHPAAHTVKPGGLAPGRRAAWVVMPRLFQIVPCDRLPEQHSSLLIGVLLKGTSVSLLLTRECFCSGVCWNHTELVLLLKRV